MGRRALAPISRLGIEAIATRIVHAASASKKLSYFSPVAQTPGFPRALARTIAELRLQNVSATDLRRHRRCRPGPGVLDAALRAANSSKDR